MNNQKILLSSNSALTKVIFKNDLQTKLITKSEAGPFELHIMICKLQQQITDN